MAPAPTVYLVDASPFVFRAAFSMPESLVDPEGRPIGAVAGFGAFLVRLLREEQPSHVAVAFDESLSSSFRNEIDPAYKANRPLPTPELLEQLALCGELARAFGLATFADERYEADDLIATLCRRVQAGGGASVVVTIDKDLGQLVAEDVTLYDFPRGERYGPAQVEQRWGVRPRQIPDLLGLAGDPVDNIPGVSRVGPRTATALLQHFADLDELLARLEEVPALPLRGARGLAQRLGEQRETALRCRRLATLVDDVPLDASVASLCWEGADRPRLEALCERLGLRSLPGRVPRWSAAGEDGLPSHRSARDGRKGC